MVFKLTQRGPLPSGLELAAQDPRSLIRLMNGSIATYRGLQTGGFTSTVEPEVVQYSLFRADRVRAVLKLRESVGQLLTFTDAGDERRLQDLYGKHQEHLTATDVIHVYVSCPPDDRPDSLERFQNDLSVLATNLRLVLGGRRDDRKVAVAVVLIKADGAYPSADEARAALPDDRLRALFHRLVLLLEGSPRVGLAALFVTSAFGYGKARRLEAAALLGAVAALADQVSRASQPSKPSNCSFVLSGIEKLLDPKSLPPWGVVQPETNVTVPSWFERLLTRVRR